MEDDSQISDSTLFASATDSELKHLQIIAIFSVYIKINKQFSNTDILPVYLKMPSIPYKVSAF